VRDVRVMALGDAKFDDARNQSDTGSDSALRTSCKTTPMGDIKLLPCGMTAWREASECIFACQRTRTCRWMHP
jgi:hypothetical protein